MKKSELLVSDAEKLIAFDKSENAPWIIYPTVRAISGICRMALLVSGVVAIVFGLICVVL